MTDLRELQHLFRDAVFEETSDGPALQAFSKLINDSAGLSAAGHLRIYRGAILGTLTRALGNIYPVCKRLLGDQFFDGMARIHARNTPSQSADLANYGGEFGDFIASFEPAATLPYLADVARLEWHWHRAFHAADEAAMDLAALNNVPLADTGRIAFRLPASARLLDSNFPVQKIWQVNQDDWQGDQDVNLDEGDASLIIWRKQYGMRIDELDSQESQLLGAIDNGALFNELSQPDMGLELDTLLPRCYQQGWIAGFTLDA